MGDLVPTPSPNPAAEKVVTARAWRVTAVVAGLFFLVACGAMIWARFATHDPLTYPALTSLKEQLAASPRDESLKTQIRTLDLRLRQQYFYERQLTRAGAWLAVMGAAAFILATWQVRRVCPPRPWFPMGPRPAEPQTRAFLLARWCVAGVAGAMLLGLVSLMVAAKSVLPKSALELEKQFATEGLASGDFAPDPELALNWPRFRGPAGNGAGTNATLNLKWDGNSGTGIAWKTEIPAPGFNSPIIWKDRVFCSGGDATKREVFCLSLGKGELLWRVAIDTGPGVAGAMPEIPEQTGFAASTLATDGRRVYAMFANGDVAALSLEGRVLWSKSLGIPKNPYGHASSLITWQDRLIVQLDQGEAEQNASRLYALQGTSGRLLWQQSRPVGASWSTPLAVSPRPDEPQIITLGLPWVISYNARNGSELWRLDALSGEVTPSPIYAGGLILAVSPNDKLLAIRPDGKGDVTKTHVAWTAEDGIPDITSPVATGDLVFILSTPGILTCYELDSGKKAWEHDLEMECHASPALIGNRLLVLGTKGVGAVLEATREFKQAGRNDLGEKVYASPALAGNRLIIRGLRHLFCLGAPESLAKSN